MSEKKYMFKQKSSFLLIICNNRHLLKDVQRIKIFNNYFINLTNIEAK